MIVIASLKARKSDARLGEPHLREQSSIREHRYSVTTPATIANFLIRST